MKTTTTFFRFYHAFALLALCTTLTSAMASSSPKQLQFADPYILFHDGLYYAYGTSHSNGIAVATSTDLKNWTLGKGRANEGVALHRDDSYGDINFWAPEVYKIGNKFIMYYSAHSRICAAEADHPLGPFKQAEQKPILDVSTIDNSLFIDDDGRAWMVYVVFDGRCIIWISEMEKDCLHAKPGTQRIIIRPELPWEGKVVTEGPFIIKVGKTYVLSYSANDYRDAKYAVGYATNNDLNAPWKKYDGNPILCKKWGLSGTGHHSLFKDKDNRWRIVFHAHNSSKVIHPRCTYIADLNIDTSGPIPKLSVGDKVITCVVTPEKTR